MHKTRIKIKIEFYFCVKTRYKQTKMSMQTGNNVKTMSQEEKQKKEEPYASGNEDKAWDDDNGAWDEYLATKQKKQKKQKKNALRHEGATAPPAPKKKEEPYASEDEEEDYIDQNCYENHTECCGSGMCCEEDEELELYQYCEWLRLKDIDCGDDETLKEFKAFKTQCENDGCETEYPFCTNDKCFFQTEEQRMWEKTFDDEEPCASGDDDNGAWDEYLATKQKKQ